VGQVRTIDQGCHQKKPRGYHRHSGEHDPTTTKRRQGRRAEGRPSCKETEDRATQDEGQLGWGTPRTRGFEEAKRASSGTAEQKGAKGKLLSE
jgi:hypothetical protein